MKRVSRGSFAWFEYGLLSILNTLNFYWQPLSTNCLCNHSGKPFLCVNLNFRIDELYSLSHHEGQIFNCGDWSEKSATGRSSEHLRVSEDLKTVQWRESRFLNPHDKERHPSPQWSAVWLLSEGWWNYVRIWIRKKNISSLISEEFNAMTVVKFQRVFILINGLLSFFKI